MDQHAEDAIAELEERMRLVPIIERELKARFSDRRMDAVTLKAALLEICDDLVEHRQLQFAVASDPSDPSAIIVTLPWSSRLV